MDTLEKYKTLQPKYELLAKRVYEILDTTIKKTRLEISSMPHREKSIKSFAEKLQRKTYSDPLSEITDLAGVRVVCMYESAIEKIENIIKEQFNVIEKVDKYQDAGSDKMGYLGIHFIVQLKATCTGPHYDGLHDLKCEIQVRTILQDSWARISHKLVYKEESSIPTKIKRDLNNVASLLEIAQKVFDSVKENREAYICEVQYKENVPDEFLSQPVDYETLRAYTEWKYKGMSISERWHNRLLSDLNFKKYPTLKEIDNIVEKSKDAVLAYQKENPDWFKDGTAYVTKSLGFGDIEFRAKHAFGQKTLDAFQKYEYLVKK